ncbi:MAG: ChaN family lipoprotein [bacterium]|nr:ChaN family lipoprotein [bacterium]
MTRFHFGFVVSALLIFIFSLGISHALTQYSSAPSYTPHRVYDSGQKRFIDFESLALALARADVVFVGEQHDDPATHRMELAILEGVARRRGSVILAMEMFERDTQAAMDRYAAGEISEVEFLSASRPWNNYATDYRPLIEFAKAQKWQSPIASNMPRRLAGDVARNGLAALDEMDTNDRGFVAANIMCPRDDYFRRFTEAMQIMGEANATHTISVPQILRLYQAQCAKDETMAESVATAWKPGGLIVHINGAFHSDFRLGVFERTKKRLRHAHVRVVTIIPVENLDGLKPTRKDRKQADYILYVLKPASSDAGH